MVHHKSPRGADALARLSTFEGIPAPYDKIKRQVVPAALRVMRLKSIREHTVLGDLANTVGWKHQALLVTLEERRKAESASYYEKKKADAALRNKAAEAAGSELAQVNEELATYGY
jgi:large subunit ribosomal protein L13Ae